MPPLGLVGAGIVHIVVLLLVPEFSERDAWSRLSMASDLYRMNRLDAEAGGAPVVKSVDPLFYATACRFDLEEGMVRIKAPGNVPFWSVSVYDRNGHNIYSFNDHTATGGKLDAVVLTPAQMIDVRKDLPEDLQGSDLRRSAHRRGHLRHPQLRAGRQLEADRVALPRSEFLRAAGLLDR